MSPLAFFAAIPLIVLHPVPAMDEQPVRVGLDGPDFDACGGVGQVVGLNPNGDNYLSVRAGPGTGNAELDRIEGGKLVWLCDAEEEWQGIVYDSGEYQDFGDCRVSSPVDEPEAYMGPCRAGWVHGKYLQLIAG